MQAILARVAADKSLWSNFLAICACGGRLAGSAGETRAAALLAQALQVISNRPVERVPVAYGGWRAEHARLSAGGQEWLFRRGTSEVLVRLQARLMLSAAEGVREAVLTGQGFAIASRWMFAPELASGEVVPVLEEWTLPPMDLWVIYPSGRLTSAKARTFVKWFEKIIGQG